MLKSFDVNSADCFRFNLTALFNNYANIMDWEKYVYLRQLFLLRGNSSYIKIENSEKF